MLALASQLGPEEVRVGAAGQMRPLVAALIAGLRPE
jgi:hypothetical protein